VFDVAFVTDADEFELLYDTAPAYAYSLLDAVCEMGFGVRLLHFGDPGDRMRAYVADRGAQRRVTAAAFGDPASLRAGLAAPEVGIVFSHFTADPRAAAAGKPTFSEADIEMGFEGFVRTVDRLVRACERRPLAAFGRWLVGSGTGGGAT
jgi:hypothetical protein